VSEPESIGIRELRQHASRYVAMAKQGKRVAVSDRGELVAYLVPAHEPNTAFQRLVAAGQVRLPDAGIKDTLASWEPLMGEPGEKRLSEVLREMRDEERS
jgi:prevent-host-death family protein